MEGRKSRQLYLSVRKRIAESTARQMANNPVPTDARLSGWQSIPCPAKVKWCCTLLPAN